MEGAECRRGTGTVMVSVDCYMGVNCVQIGESRRGTGRIVVSFVCYMGV